MHSSLIFFRSVLGLAAVLAAGVLHASPFVETFGVTATRQPSQYVPQFNAAGTTSYYRFADPNGISDQQTINDGYYAVIKPNQIIATGGGSWWQTQQTGSIANFTDHTGDGGAVLVVNAGNTMNSLYRRIAILQQSTIYTMSAWRFVVSGPTNLSFKVNEPDDSGVLSQSPQTTTSDDTGVGTWVKLSWTFTTRACGGERQYAVSVENNSLQSNGNDLFLDDIALQPDAGGTPVVTLPCPSRTLPTVTAASDAVSTLPGRPAVVNVLANDVVVPRGAVALAAPTPGPVVPQHGSVVFNADGTVTYTPQAGFIGADAFSYSVCTAASRTNPTPFCSSAQVAMSVGYPDTPVPTLSQWGMAIMAALMAMAGVFCLRRRR